VSSEAWGNLRPSAATSRLTAIVTAFVKVADNDPENTIAMDRENLVCRKWYGTRKIQGG